MFTTESNPNFSSPNGVLYNGDKTVLICYPQGREGGYTIPNSVRTIADYAFRGCRGLVFVEIPNSVVNIGEEAFWDCSGLTSLEIPNSVLSIQGGAFAGCSRLTSVGIPGSVKSIGNRAFSGCAELALVEIPKSVTSISNKAFYDCSSLEVVVVGWETPLEVYNSIFEGVPVSLCKLKVPLGTKKHYEKANVWKNFQIVE